MITNRFVAPKFRTTNELAQLLVKYEKKNSLLANDKEIGISTASSISKYMIIWSAFYGCEIFYERNRYELKSLLQQAVLSKRGRKLSMHQIDRVLQIMNELAEPFILWPWTFERNMAKCRGQKVISKWISKLDYNAEAPFNLF